MAYEILKSEFRSNEAGERGGIRKGGNTKENTKKWVL
jgi:hypothetical protein